MMATNIKSSIFSFTTLPRSKRSTKTQDTGNSRSQRGLASLNIITAEVPPVPPPRSKRVWRQRSNGLRSMPVVDSVQLSEPPELPPRLPPKLPPRTSSIQPLYSKYELKRTTLKDKFSLPHIASDKETCDIIQSSQNPRPANEQHPDLLVSSFRADKTRNTTTSKQGKMSLNSNNIIRRDLGTNTDGNARFVFYKPSHSNNDAGSVERSALKPAYSSKADKSIQYHGGDRDKKSFDNPAFSLVESEQALRRREPNQTRNGIKSKVKVKPNALPSKTIYSTVGSPYSLKSCDSPVPKSPLSAKFKKSFTYREVPAPPVEAPRKTAPVTGPAPAPQVLKPILSARKLETCLKQYSSVNRALSPARLDTSVAVTASGAAALDNMMKYYGMTASEPPPSETEGKLRSKTGSPYSSSSSLNGTGDTVEVIMRRKKKVKIRPPSVASDDGESIKRVSLEINLLESSTTEGNNFIYNEPGKEDNSSSLESSQKPFTVSQASLSQSIENLSLDDLTTTETARYLRKQFTKLKSRANSLRVKDNELKQRFVQLQHRRGKVCGGGSITKTRGRMSPTPVGFL